MRRHGNEEGFVVTTVILIVVGVVIVGFTGWRVLALKIQNGKATSQQNTATSTVTAPTNPITAKNCSSGRIIVYFKTGVTKTRQIGIINAENATINREYDQFNGYALNVPKGTESSASQAFLKHADIQSASPEGCPDAPNSAQPSN